MIQASLRRSFCICYGTLLLGFGTVVFLLPHALVTGGVAGLSLLLAEGLPLSPALISGLLSVLLFFVGWWTLGHAFAARTLLSALVYPLSVLLFSQGGFDAAGHALWAAALGGLLVGTGCALAFRSGGSTGGMDALALLLCRHFPSLHASSVMLGIDLCIILLGLPLLQDLHASLLGILSACICSTTIRALYGR